MSFSVVLLGLEGGAWDFRLDRAEGEKCGIFLAAVFLPQNRVGSGYFIVKYVADAISAKGCTEMCGVMKGHKGGKRA